MKKIRHKHNKKRNTAFLFEALIRELSKSIIQQDLKKKKEVISVIKENFKKGSFLQKELELYRSIYETKKVDVFTAEKILTEVKNSYKEDIDKEQLFNEQTKLINTLNKKFPNSALNNFLPNYKYLASISQIFGNIPVRDRVILENIIVRKMSTLEREMEKMKPIGNLAFNTFIKKFNSVYGKDLFTEQKELLQRYITSFENNGLEFKIYLNKEIGRLKEEVKKIKDIKEAKDDHYMLEKIEKVENILVNFKDSDINSDMLEKVIKIQSLIRENQENVG